MPQPTPHAQHTVLVVDDEESILAILSQLLTRAGLRVRTATNVNQALAVLTDEVPCLVLTDVLMPGLDGLELCRRVKHDPRTAHVPVILVTGRTDERDVDEGVAAGAADYIKKPFDRDEVRMRVRTHIRLHESRIERERVDRQLATISAAAKDAIVLIDDTGAITHWNQAAEAMFGYTHDEAMGRHLHTMLTPERFRGAHQQAFPQFRLSGDGGAVGKTVELYATRKAGDEIPIELSLSAAHVDGAWCAVGIVRDISERKRMEQAASESAALFRTMLNAIPLPVFCKDVEGRYVGVNPAFEAFFGVAEGDLLGKTVFDVLPAPEATLQQSHDIGLLDQSRHSVVYDAQLRDGQGVVRDLEVHKATFTDGSGHVRGVIGALRDLTDRKRMASELDHARKLEAVGQLAAGIAHEINTPTQYGGDSVAFLQEAFAGITLVLDQRERAVDALRVCGGHDDLIRGIADVEADVDLEYLAAHVPDSFSRCLDGVGRISTIVRAMKEFAHPDTREKVPADLNQALRSTLVIASNEYKYVADVDTEFGDLPLVPCHIGDLNQVFLNLLVNAAHAIGEACTSTGARGRIRVSTRRDDCGVHVGFSDTGSGIPDPIRHRIFEPFFTTKEVGKGTGQGLAIARSIVVDKHGGALTFDTQVGVGTTFTITLPLEAAGHPTAGVPQ